MQKYDSYKDSGIQWLGEIPSHWGIYKIRYNYYLKGRIGWQGLKSNEFCDVGPYLVTGTDFERGRIIWERCYHISQKRYDEAPEIHVMEGDLLMTKDGTVGKTAYVDSKPPQVSLNSHLLIVRPLYKGKCDNKFLQYVIYSNIFVDFYKIYSSGSIMESISQEKFCDFRFPLPHIKEQQAIASYLDTATAKIDEAIAQQQKMIDLLNERKQIIINNAVTKGLNPNAKMKPSGIDWIGNIPEHWEVGRLKTILKVKDKRNTDPNALLLSVFTAIGVRPRQELEERGNKATTVLNYKIVNKGDLIVNRLLAWMGAYGLSNHDGVTSPDYDVYSFHADVNKEYYETFFRNTKFKSDCYKYGHGIMMMRWRTYSDEFLNINVPIPPREEQDEIYNYLKPMIEKIDSGVSNCSQMISFLQERKQIIINDVVTGKVKVL